MTQRPTHIAPQEVCYRAFELIRDVQFADAAKLLAHWLGRTNDHVELALFHSAFGVLEKRRGDFKAALRHYERAEKLLPHDPAIKLIAARLLIEVYHETDRAIRKCRQAVKLLPDNPAVVHHAHTLEGLAYARGGDRRKALARLETSMGQDFAGFLSCENIDFHLVETCARRGWGLPLCRRFLQSAVQLARRHQQIQWVALIEQILAKFPLAETHDTLR